MRPPFRNLAPVRVLKKTSHAAAAAYRSSDTREDAPIDIEF